MTPAWILDILAAAMLAVAGISAARLAAARPRQRGPVVTGIDLAHLLMAIAMAGTLAASLTTLPGTMWEAIFGLLTVWFACQAWREARANGSHALARHCAPHLAHSAAMLYMFAALMTPAADSPLMGGTSGPVMRTLHYPALAFVFTLVLAAYSVWDLDQLSSTRHGFTAAVAGVPGAALAGVPASAAPMPRPSPSQDRPPRPVRTDLRSRLAEADQAVASGGGSGRSGARGALLSPGTTVGCRIVMGVTMALMLLIMI